MGTRGKKIMIQIARKESECKKMRAIQTPSREREGGRRWAPEEIR